MPVDEEDDHSNVVSIVEPFETTVGPPPSLFHSKPNHGTQSGSHDPTSKPRAGRKVDQEEFFDQLPRAVVDGCSFSEDGEVDHMRADVNCREEHDRPCNRFVERDIFIEWDDIVQRSSTKHGDEVATDRKEDKNNINMEDKCG